MALRDEDSVMTSAECYDGPGHDYHLVRCARIGGDRIEAYKDRIEVNGLWDVVFCCRRCGAEAKHGNWLPVRNGKAVPR